MLTRVGVVVVTGAFTGVAAADTVDVKFLGTGNGTANWVSVKGNARYVFAGQLEHRFSNGVGQGEQIDGDFITFCTDLTQFVSGLTRTFTVENLEDLPQSPGVLPMGADAAQAVFDIYKAAGGAQLDPGADKALASAFQLAIWEIVYDYDAQAGVASLDVGDGDFRVTAFQNGYADEVGNHPDRPVRLDRQRREWRGSLRRRQRRGPGPARGRARAGPDRGGGRRAHQRLPGPPAPHPGLGSV